MRQFSIALRNLLPFLPCLSVEEPEPSHQRCSDEDHGEHANSDRVPSDCRAREPQRKFQCQQDSKHDTCRTCIRSQQSPVTFCEIRLLNCVRLEIVAAVASRGVRGIHELAVRAVHQSMYATLYSVAKSPFHSPTFKKAKTRHKVVTSDSVSD